MAVKTLFYRCRLASWEKLVGSKDAALRARLEATWFAEKVIADQERKPDQALMASLVDEGELYGELDDETSLRMDKMVILLFEKELGATPLPLTPMRDDLQRLVSALRDAAGGASVVGFLDHLANGRRFDASETPIDVPHYAWLRASEVKSLADGAAAIVEKSQPRGLFGKLLGGAPRLSKEAMALLGDIARQMRSLATEGSDLFSVNRDPAARWDMA